MILEKKVVLTYYFMFVILQFADGLFTLGGLKLGYSEGNPLILYLLRFFPDYAATLIIPMFILLLLSFPTLYLIKKMHLISASDKAVLFYIVTLALLWRTFIVGVWFGNLDYVINGID